MEGFPEKRRPLQGVWKDDHMTGVYGEEQGTWDQEPTTDM